MVSTNHWIPLCGFSYISGPIKFTQSNHLNAITYRVALEVASHEAIVRQAYKDSVGVWTWSVGLTSATGHNVERYIGKPQPLEQCLKIFVWALDKYAAAVRKEFAGVQLTEAQFAAALSFHWNTGSIAKASWVDAFKRGDMAAAEKSFLSWNKAGGKVVKGLVSRRQKEADLLFRGKWSNDGTILEYTRVTSSYTPVWSSGQKVNVEAPLKTALGVTAVTPTETQDAALRAPEATQKASGGLVGLLWDIFVVWWGSRR